VRIFGHADFEGAFESGTVFRCPTRGKIAVHQLEIDNLILRSGQLIACDPAYLCWEEDRVPFTRTGPTGRHKVLLSISDAEERAFSGLVSCAMVRFTSQKPASWEMALLPGQDPATLPHGHFFGYGVDTGMGCFIDADTARRLSKDAVDRALHEVTNFLRPSQASGKPRKYGVGVVIDQPSGANIVVFDSGYGDGAYVSYWGIDARGELCCLVTDFGVLVEHLQGRATFPIQDCLGQQLSHPDLARIGVSIRVLPKEGPDQRRLRVEAHGVTDSCDAKVINASKTYSSSYSVRPNIHLGAWDFQFNEPLNPDAVLVLEYGLGAMALERIHPDASI
jgi:hypothetical protein